MLKCSSSLSLHYDAKLGFITEHKSLFACFGVPQTGELPVFETIEARIQRHWAPHIILTVVFCMLNPMANDKSLSSNV